MIESADRFAERWLQGMSDTEIPGSKHIRFGLFDVDLRSGELLRQGIKIKLQEQPFQVLVMLLERPGEIVSREEIQQRLWPSTNVDFETNLNAALKRLRDALDDSADNPRFVETVRGRGYRFIAAAGRPPNAVESGARAVDPSIAVLPFRDRSPLVNQEYFCDGITEELTDALTKVENLRVVSRISAFQYKNKTDDVRKIGSELNVGTLLEGSLQKTEDRLRIKARLTSVKDGGQLWFESYECDIRDVFEIQDEITDAIISALAHKLGWRLSQSTGPQLILSKPSLTKDPVAYDLYLKGLYLWNLKDRQSIRKSITWFQQAIERDRDYALAYAALADAYMTLAKEENDPAERIRLYTAGQNEIAKYLGMVRENYEQKTAD
jgi:TolB-like protein